MWVCQRSSSRHYYSICHGLVLTENTSHFFCLHLRWKYDGPSDSFKALIDMAAVHSSCRLCIHIATKIHLKEEMTPKFTNRPCSCSSKKGTVYHLFVRERGRFKSESIYMRYGSLTVVLTLYFWDMKATKSVVEIERSRKVRLVRLYYNDAD
jgi:hypothetical protein